MAIMWKMNGCGACTYYEPDFDNLAYGSEFRGKVAFGKINWHNNNVQSSLKNTVVVENGSIYMPQFLVYKNNQMIGKVSSSALARKLRECMSDSDNDDNNDNNNGNKIEWMNQGNGPQQIKPRYTDRSLVLIWYQTEAEKQVIDSLPSYAHSDVVLGLA